ncbi:MAG: ABC transporter permease [Candidatus Promineifilaceae bacterium]|nr:ABC transporter permease [Candidatus Promineifilaceae bacterium]
MREGGRFAAQSSLHAPLLWGFFDASRFTLSLVEIMWKKLVRLLNAQPTWSIVLVSFFFLIVGWHFLVIWGNYPAFILPGPGDVWQQFLIVLGDGRLIRHSLITVSEIIPGLLIGFLIALPLGYLLAKSPLADRLLSPYLIASQAIPIIAIAPLLTIWVTSAYWARVWVAVLVVFFPILVSSVTGIRSVPPELYELMHSLRATRGQIFRKLEIPASMPVLIAGLKVGATLAVIGTLVGEFVQPKSEGLGFLLVTARYQFKTDLVFVILIMLVIIALTLYGLVALMEKRLLHWRTPQQSNDILSQI